MNIDKYILNLRVICCVFPKKDPAQQLAQILRDIKQQTKKQKGNEEAINYFFLKLSIFK